MKLIVVCYKDNKWYQGFVKGHGATWNHSSLSPIKDFEEMYIYI